MLTIIRISENFHQAANTRWNSGGSKKTEFHGIYSCVQDPGGGNAGNHPDAGNYTQQAAQHHQTNGAVNQTRMMQNGIPNMGLPARHQVEEILASSNVDILQAK